MSRKIKKVLKTGTAIKVGGITVLGVGIVGGAFFLYQRFKDFKLKFPNLGFGDFLGGMFGKEKVLPSPLDPAAAFVKPETIISLENIQSIAQDEAISVSERITILKMMLTEQLANIDMEYSEIGVLESKIMELEADLQIAEAQLPFLEADIKAEKTDVYNAKQKESRKNRILQGYKDDMASAQKTYNACDKSWLGDGCRTNAKRWMDDIKLQILDAERDLYNAEQARKREEDQYNKVMSAKSAYMESNVNPIRIELEANRDSLNTWIIAFSAAEQLTNAIGTEIIKLEGL